MMIGNCCGAHTAASQLGTHQRKHDARHLRRRGPEAKRAAVNNAENGFDFGLDGIGNASFLDAQDAALGANVQIAAPGVANAAPMPGGTFTVEQLETMLAAAKGREVRNA